MKESSRAGQTRERRFMPSENIADKIQDAVFRLKQFVLGPYRTRRARIYCVGMGKTGTHSIAGMFLNGVRAVHEADAKRLITKILDWREGHITERQFTDWLLARDRSMALEVDSSGPNFHLIETVLREFPDARFILTVRDCYTWLDSVVNHQLRFPEVGQEWQRMRNYRFGKSGFVYAPSEKILQEKGLYPLESYLSLWAMHNNEVIAKIPPEKLLIVRTDQIKKRAYEIADFCGLPRRSVCLERTHEFQNKTKQLSLRQIDRAYLERLVEKHCRPLMTRFFPEIKSLDDTKP
jgi:hypothetical protein